MRHSLTDTLAELTRSLEPDFELDAMDGVDRPVFLAIARPVHEGATGLKPRLPAGRGLTPRQARFCAGAEALELRASLAQHHLSRLAALPRRDGLAMATARDLLTGEEVPVPAQEVWLDCAPILDEPMLCDAGSSGCAVGDTLEGAIAGALSECIERDAVALWWHGGLPPGSLPLDLIDSAQPRLVWWLEGRGRVTRLFDLTTDIGLPVVLAVSSEPDGRHVAVGSAARLLPADAALAAVTEMVQTEAAMDAARAVGDPEVLAWDAVASTGRQPQFRAGKRPCPVAAQDLPGRLDALGLRALMVDLSLPGDPLPTVRVLVPGLCGPGGRIDTPRFRRLCPANPSPSFPEPY